MARPRHGPSLFEVLRVSEPENAPPDTQKVKGLRRWFRRDTAEWERETPADRERIEAETHPVLSAADSGDEIVESAPLASIQGSRLTISLTCRHAAVAAFAALVFVFVVFAAGDRFGQRDFQRGYAEGRASSASERKDEIARLRHEPPTPGLVDGLLVAAPGVPPAKAGSTPQSAPLPRSGAANWVRGWSYVVVQEFQAEKLDDAQKARAFLQGRGVNGEVVTLTNGKHQLIATQGFQSKNPAEKQSAEALLKQIHDLGAQYFATGGGYRLQGYYRTFKGERW